MVTSTYVPRLLTYDYLHQIADAAHELPDIIYTYEIAREDVLVTRHQVFENFVKATADGVRWALKNPDQAASIAAMVTTMFFGFSVRRGRGRNRLRRSSKVSSITSGFSFR